MSIPCFAIVAVLASVTLTSRVAAQSEQTSSVASSGTVTTAVLAGEVRILGLLKEIGITRNQIARLLPMAENARGTLDSLETEQRKRIEDLRPMLLATRRALLRDGEEAPADAIKRYTSAVRDSEQRLRRKKEELANDLTRRLPDVLTPEQTAKLRELAGMADLSEVAPEYVDFPDPRRASRDVRDMIEDLEKLRVPGNTARGQQRAQDIREKFVEGADPLSADYRRLSQQADTLIRSVVSMPPALFAQQKVSLGLMAARIEQEGKQRRRNSRSDLTTPHRYFAEEALLSEPSVSALRAFSP